MSAITQAASAVATALQANEAKEANNTKENQKKTKFYGKTIGDVQLSEKAASYYEKLKKKYSNMDFILVSKDQKEQAQAQAGSYGNANKMVVLIDEEKIERMAEDEKFREQYEGIIRNAATGLSQMKSSLASTGANVKTYGIQVNDNGTASFFAVIDKSLAAQRERIAKKSEEKAEAKKKAQAKAEEERAADRQAKRKEETTGIHYGEETENTVTITASSVEELIQKINQSMYLYQNDQVQTEQEKMVGQHFDFRM